MQKNLALFYIIANTSLVPLLFYSTSLQLSDSVVFIPTFEISMSTSEQPNITIIGTVVFIYTSKLAEASNIFYVSSKYYKFSDVFSKIKAEVLISHYIYDPQINLEECTQPLVGPIYSLLVSKQEALKKFIKENLNTDFI